jgi:predicted transposase YbfD/YdcC
VGARRALGLGKRTPSDTTLYRLLAEQDSTGLEETVVAQVKDLIARKVVKHDRFRVGVVSFDGKGTWSRTDGEPVEGAKRAVDDFHGVTIQSFGAMRAALTSSSVCPCVGQKVIGSKEGEVPAFRELFPRVCEALGERFKIITGDAGLCARESAELVAEHGRWYLFTLKGNQPHLHGLASDFRCYEMGVPLARTTDRYRGHSVVRELYAVDVAGSRMVDIADAQQLWYVCQTTHAPNGECVAVEQRYFVTSIPSRTFSRGEELALVRLHWAIENGCHWAMDVALREDEAQPCQVSRAAIEAVSWLRILGYNAVSAWRQLAPQKDRKPISWERAKETLRDALVLARRDHLEPLSADT